MSTQSTAPIKSCTQSILTLYPSWIMGRTDIVRDLDEDGVRILRIKVCRTCQSSLRNCVCGNPVPGSQPLPIIWRAGQSENARLMNYLSKKKSTQAQPPSIAQPTQQAKIAPAAVPTNLSSTAPMPVFDPSYRSIPETMRKENRWLAFQITWNPEKDKFDKKPVNSKGTPTNDPTKGESFDVMLGFVLGNPGFVLGFYIEEPYLAIDADGCRDKETGVIAEWARGIIAEADSYSEISPSGTGVRIIAEGKKPGDYCRRGNLEIYTTGRAVTMTALHIAGTPGVVNKRDITGVYREMEAGAYLFGKGKAAGEKFGTHEPSRNEQSAQIESGGNVITSKLVLLSTGEFTPNSKPFMVWDDYDNVLQYPSQSEAVGALLVCLAYKHDCDSEKIEEGYLESGLSEIPVWVDKWNRRSDDEIKHAIDFVRKHPRTSAQSERIASIVEPAEDMKGTSLLIFRTAEDSARAAELGFNSIVAADFKPPLDSRFNRVVLFDTGKDDLFRSIAASIPNRGSIFTCLPRDDSKPAKGYGGRTIGAVAEHLTDVPADEAADYLTRLLDPRGAVASASVNTPRMRLIEVPEGSTCSIVSTEKTNVADAIAVSPDVLQIVNNLLFTTTKERAEMGLPANSKRAANKADTIIYNDLQKRGTFYNANGLGCLVLHGLESAPVKISEHETDCLDVLEKYELHAGRPDTNAVGKYLGVRAGKDGEHVNLSISFHYNPRTHTAYYAEERGKLLKVTREGITTIRNGEESVLFTYPDNYESWQFSPEMPAIKRSLVPARGSALYDALFKELTFENSTMTDEQKYILLTVYLVFLFLPGLNKTKMLLQTIGPSGSGKSFFLEIIGRMLLGPQFSTQPMPCDTKEFENQVVNSSYIAYDNVNKIEPKIADLLCQVATGMNVTRRELFTTSGQVSLPALATVAISGINPVLTEVEHVNRSLILSMKKRNNFMSAVDLLADLDQRRGEIMSEIVHRVRMVLVALHAQRNYRPPVSIRLADIATFLLRVARHEGWEADAKTLLTAWADEQTRTAMSDDEIGQAISYVLRDPAFEPKWKTPSEFQNTLVAAAQANRMSLGWWASRSPKTMSVALVKNEDAYRSRYGLEFDKDDHTGNRRFRLNPSPDLLAAIRKPWEPPS